MDSYSLRHNSSDDPESERGDEKIRALIFVTWNIDLGAPKDQGRATEIITVYH
jgi:hypothetical protein